MSQTLIAKYKQDLKLKGYQPRSIQTYHRTVRMFWNYCNKPLEECTEEDLRAYWLFCTSDLGWGRSTLRISYSGIKLFFKVTLRREWEILRSLRFEHSKTLPVVLNIDEVRELLSYLRQPQNHTFFSLVYSCGLRLCEALHVTVQDIDGQRRQLHVHHGKGAKDRIIQIPESTLTILRCYWREHRNPVWMFPALGKDGKGGKVAEKPVSAQTVQGALRRALKRSAIRKKVTPHTLRHSYATHLIEAGVPVRHVQESLGHDSLTSTMIYLHITTHGREDTRKRVNQLMRGVFS